VKKFFLILGVLFLVFSFSLSSARAEVVAETNLPAPGILPDSPFYFFKTFWESVNLALTFNPVAKTEKMMHFAEKRLAEAQALVEKGKDDLAEKVLAKYRKQVSAVVQKAQKLSGQGEKADQALSKVTEKALKHEEVLTDLYKKLPPQAQPAVAAALEASMKGQQEAFQALSEREKVKMWPTVNKKVSRVKTLLQKLKKEKEEKKREAGLRQPQPIPTPVLLRNLRQLTKLHEEIEEWREQLEPTITVIRPTVEALKEQKKELREELEPTAEALKKQLEEIRATVQPTKEALKKQLEEARKEREKTTTEAQEKAAEVVEEAQKTAQEATQKAQEAVEEAQKAVEEATEAAQEAVSQEQELQEELKEKQEELEKELGKLTPTLVVPTRTPTFVKTPTLIKVPTLLD